MPPRCRFVAPTVAAAGLALLAAACSDTTGLPRAVSDNVVDRVSLFALFAAPISTPSAYDLSSRLGGGAANALVRTAQASAFDFAFNFDSLRRPVLLPPGAVGLGQSSGLQRASRPFDSITVAPTGGVPIRPPHVVAPRGGAVARPPPPHRPFIRSACLSAP